MDGAERLLLVEANTTGTGVAAIETVREIGLRPLFATADPGRYPELPDLGDGLLRCDTGSAASVRRQLPGPLAGVATTSEFYVDVVARLAAALGLPGASPAAIATCRNKAATREALAAGGLPQPRFAAIDSVADLAAALDAVGLPCVVKPVDDTGSLAVRLCASEADAARQVRGILAMKANARGRPTAGRALVEELLRGPELSVETLSRGGEHRCLGIVAKGVTGRPHFVEHRHVFPAPLPGEAAAEVAQTAVRALELIGLQTGVSHVELKLTERGPAPIEVNARPAGGMIPAVMAEAVGLDPVECHLRAACGLEPEPVRGDRSTAGIQFLLPPRPGRLLGVEGIDAVRRLSGVRRVHLTKPPGSVLSEPASAYDRVGWAIARGEDATEVEATLDRVTELAAVRVEGS